MSNISINMSSVGERATSLENAGSDLIEQAASGITFPDEVTTVSSNQNIKDAFQKSQDASVTFGEALRASGVQIYGIGERFAEIDHEAASGMHQWVRQ